MLDRYIQILSFLVIVKIDFILSLIDLKILILIILSFVIFYFLSSKDQIKNKIKIESFVTSTIFFLIFAYSIFFLNYLIILIFLIFPFINFLKKKFDHSFINFTFVVLISIYILFIYRNIDAEILLFLLFIRNLVNYSLQINFKIFKEVFV